jgi:hypothetical protein
MFKRTVDDTSPLPKVLGFSGLKRSGKDTAAEILREECRRYSVHRIAFADSLREALRAVFGFSDEQMFGSQKEEVDPFWGLSYRQAAQRVGTDLFRDQLDPQVWIKSWQKRVLAADDKNCQMREAMYAVKPLLVLVTDVRFPNEADAIRELGGEVWRIRREGLPFDGHASEVMAARAPDDFFNRVVDNSTGLTEFRRNLRMTAKAAGLLE